MTDPELQALAEKMTKAVHRAYDPHHASVMATCAQVAADFFAERLARADAIEQAARQLVDAHATGMHRMPDHMARERALGALRAALEAS